MGRPAKYPEEFRREAVALYRSSDRSVVEVAESSGSATGRWHNWVKADRDARARAAIDGFERVGARGVARREGKRRAAHGSRDPAQGSRVFCSGDDPVSRSGSSPTTATSIPVKRLCGSSRSHARASTSGAAAALGARARRPGAAGRDLRHPPRSRRTYGAPRVHGQLATPASATAASGWRGSWRSGSSVSTATQVAARSARHRAGAGPAGARLHRRAVRPAVGRRHHRVPDRDGKLYLAGIKDLCDHGLVGWSMGERQTPTSSSTRS